jgi:hypothetical protein
MALLWSRASLTVACTPFVIEIGLEEGNGRAESAREANF